MDYNPQALEKIMAGNIIGHKVYHYREITSTNDEAFRLGIEGAKEGTAVIAESQTAGKGRMQRSWHSPPGTNIYTSVILRPDFAPVCAPQISILAGVAVNEILKKIILVKAHLKWPNDVLIGGKKVCGILAQMKTIQNKIDFIVLGIGININSGAEQFPPEIMDISTSLAMETGGRHSCQELLISLYKNLSKWYKILVDDGFEKIKERWLSMTEMMGCNIQVKFKNEVIRGKAVDIDEQGSLIVINSKGAAIKILSGDASILKEK